MLGFKCVYLLNGDCMLGVASSYCWRTLTFDCWLLNRNHSFVSRFWCSPSFAYVNDRPWSQSKLLFSKVLQRKSHALVVLCDFFIEIRVNCLIDGDTDRRCSLQFFAFFREDSAVFSQPFDIISVATRRLTSNLKIISTSSPVCDIQNNFLLKSYFA